MTRLTKHLGWTLALALALPIAPKPSLAATPQEEALPEGAAVRLGTLRFRNGGPLQAVRYLQNGKVVASVGGADQTLRFWDAATGELRGQFVPPVGCPAAFSPDGRVAAVTEDRAVVLYDTNTGKVLHRLSDPKRLLVNPVFAPDGKTLATTLQTAVELPPPVDAKAGDVQDRIKALMDALRGGGVPGAPPGAVGQMLGVRLWEVAGGKKIRDFREKKTDGVQDFVSMAPVFVSENRVGFRGTRNGENSERLLLWDEQTGKPLPEAKAPESSVNGFTLAPDGKKLVRFVLQPADNSVRAVLCELESGKVIRNLGEPLVNGGPSAVTFSPDGKLLVLVDNQPDVLHVIDVATGKDQTTITLDATDGVGVGSVTFSPDGSLVAVPNLQGKLILYDVVKGTPKHEFKGAQLNFTNNLIIGGFGGIQPGMVLTDGTGFWDAPVSFTPDGKRVAVTGTGGTVKIFDLTTGKEVRVGNVGHDAGVVGLVFSGDGRWLATVGEDNVVILWDRAAHTEKRRFVGPENVNFGEGGMVRTALALSADGKRIAAGWIDGKIQVWDEEGKELHKLDGGESYIGALAFTPDGKRLASAAADGNLLLWDMATGKQERALTGPIAGDESAGEHALAVSPDGRFLAAVGPGGDGSRVRLWELTTARVRLEVSFRQNAQGARQEVRFIRGGGRVVQQVVGANGGAGPLAFAPGGRFLAVGNGDVVLLVDLDHGREVRRFGFSSGSVQSVAFSPDGKALVAVGGEGTARIWDVATATVTGRVEGHRGPANCVAFAPDGKFLATGGADTTVLLWDAKAALRPKTELPAEVTEKDLPALWEQLGSTDAEAAFVAMTRLAGAPARSVPWVRKKLPAAVAPNAERIEELLAQLESEKADSRKEAVEKLTQLRELVEPALRKRLAEKPPELTRFVIERLLERGDKPGPELVRALRAVELLEQIGDAEALAALRELAKGAAGARLTLEAESAVNRLAPAK